ncbi:hypothetical protein DPEC_G00349590 [Dallia pectoralis]|uniref:Uncharacterized protein n=1 Tax=Dallia pectoralis TaxID=75939 RepID=A0ACC2F1G2_DALPE|nr:hypothetical protein DPEC_G00349590 [Dallia pectoralis]
MLSRQEGCATDKVSNMNNYWIVFALCISHVIGEAIYSRIGRPDAVKIKCGAKTSNMDVEWSYQAVGSSGPPIMINSLNGKSGKQRKGTAPMVNRAILRESSLEIQAVETDAGQYICKVNREEKGSHSLYMISVTVNPPSPLDEGSQATLNCQVSGPSPLPSVEWLRPGGVVAGDSGMVSLNPVALTDHGEWSCRISQGEKTQDESLTVYIKAHTTTPVKSDPDSISHPSRSGLENQATHRTSWDAGSQNVTDWSMLGLSLWVWLPIGAGGLGLIVLLVTGVFLLCRNRRMKKRRQKIRNNGELLKANYCQCKSTTSEGPPQKRT